MAEDDGRFEPYSCDDVGVNEKIPEMGKDG
jgi:hypothetical protein